jgi:hypothetical protein
VVVVGWKEAEACERAELFGAHGLTARPFFRTDRSTLAGLREQPPDVVVIDLARAPSRGRDLAIWVRRQKATRHVPLVFVGGEPEKTGRIRETLPDALYTKWEDVFDAIRSALECPNEEPVVPDTMAGYSGTPLPRKLGIKRGSRVLLMGAPEDFDQTLGELPPRAVVARGDGDPAGVVLFFVRSLAELKRDFGRAANRTAAGGRLWIVWPKKASGICTDVSQTEVRTHGLAAGWVDYKIAAIDATWSGLCFSRRSG